MRSGISTLSTLRSGAYKAVWHLARNSWAVISEGRRVIEGRTWPLQRAMQKLARVSMQGLLKRKWVRAWARVCL